MRFALLRRSQRHLFPLSDGTVRLQAPAHGDFSQWRALRAESASFLQPWEPKWPFDDLTAQGFRRRLNRYELEADRETGYTAFIQNCATGELVGGLSLTNIRQGASRSCTLGYWMGERHAGKGLMRRSVTLVLDAVFTRLQLSRVEAACLPENTRSIALLGRCGFHEEGIAREYLEINGVRRDHLLFATLASEHASLEANGQTLDAVQTEGLESLADNPAAQPIAAGKHTGFMV